MFNDIKTFEDACNALNIQPSVPDFTMVPEKHQKAMLAHYKLVIIVEAVNEGWTPDWSNDGEWKYELWPDIIEDKSKPSGFGLAYHGYVSWHANARVGSRLCFKSREVAKYTFETFKDLYEDYLLIG